jgi:superfamily II DNA or RNA helicase
MSLGCQNPAIATPPDTFMTFTEGSRLRLPGESALVVIDGAIPSKDGSWRLYVRDGAVVRAITLTADDVGRVELLAEDGTADSSAVLAGLWAEWMRRAAVSSKATALASSPLNPYPHQNRAVYGTMLPQPLLRFLLADEPGTGKTIMGGLWLREAQRLGFVKRALIVCPAHLVSKWQADFERFLGGDLRRIEGETIRQDALATSHDLWVVSLELAAVNQAVYEAIHPDRAGWDAVLFDEAHRMTPTAVAYHRVGRMLALNTPRAVLMTATPHRGNEWLFRALMHLVDPKVFPAVERLDKDQPSHSLKPGPLHFLRRMKEELVDYDGATKLFKAREARNVPVPLNTEERGFYNEALDLVDTYFPASATTLAKMVYGKRAASSLYALSETLRRRRDGMGSENPSDAAHDADPYDEDEAAQDEARVVAEASKAMKDEKKAIGAMLDRLDKVVTDPHASVSKWPKLEEECLVSNGIAPGSGRQLVVFTEFADTADWLVQRFKDAGYSTRRYSGRDSHGMRDEIRADFAAHKFQVIVSTDAGNEGIDLQSAQVLVNWDIPWSLVRLEQRMGRIHRVGQTQKVWLYNLVATDTREGEAHARLLDNLIEAANELGGKMFDSLSLVGEAALAEAGVDSLEKLLQSTYQSGNTDPALNAIRSITRERLRQIHNAQRQADDVLKSGIDVNAALTAFHDDRLERINPHIVERFLNRIASAGLLSVEQAALADQGLWYLTPGALALPEELRPEGSTGKTLVATSGKAKRDAIECGQARAAAAITLGPSEPPFRALAHAVSDGLRPALYQGASLNDPTTVTDYELHTYEVDTDEGDGRSRNTWSYLVRVDATGAHTVAWEILANLEPSADPAGSPHPASTTNAEYAAALSLDRDRAGRAAAMDEWLTGARNQLRRLPNDLTDDITRGDERRATRAQLEKAVEERIGELELAISIKTGELRRIGWARVIGTGVPPEPTEKDSEKIAQAHVVRMLSDQGWKVADVHTEGRGYDVHARKGRDQRCVEVKGVWESAASRGITLTGNELAKAGLLGNEYWLYVVDQCRGGGSLYAAFQNPAIVFADATRDIAVLKIAGSALKAAKEGSPA